MSLTLPEVVESPHPRLFAVHRSGAPGDASYVVAHGVLWPDGSANVSWAGDDASTAKRWWSTLESMAGTLGDGLTVVWLRQDEHAGA